MIPNHWNCHTTDYMPPNKSDAYSVNNLFSDANSLNKGKDYLHNANLYYKHKWGTFL